MKENGVEVGYTITFQTGKSITIRHGVDGINGETPVIGVAKDTDGVYYWTVKIGDAAAEFMTDGAGNKIPVTGPKGVMRATTARLPTPARTAIGGSVRPTRA